MEPFVSFQVAAIAVGKQRPRLGRGRVYTPKETVDFERLIGWEAKLAMKGRRPTHAPCVASIRITRKRPKKTKLYAPAGDTDNFAKSILDGMNKIVFDDDKQIVTVTATKHWGNCDMITVMIAEIQSEAA